MTEWPVLIPGAEIKARVWELGVGIANRTRDSVSEEDLLVVVGLLTGAFVFTADLVRVLASMRVPHEVHLVSPVALPSLRQVVRHREVLLVDDICDGGATLNDALGLLSFEPKHLHRVVLLARDGQTEMRRRVRLDADIRHREEGFDLVGFTLLSDAWVVGYGMDSGPKGGHGLARGLPYISYLSDPAPTRLRYEVG